MMVFWLHRQHLPAHGAITLLVQRAAGGSAGATSQDSRIDTERLLRSLVAYLRGEPKLWSAVRVPSVAKENARRLHRERGRLASDAFGHVNRIKGLCALQGITAISVRRSGQD
jgi:transposase